MGILFYNTLLERRVASSPSL